MTWPVTQGLITEKDMDEMVRVYHKNNCGSFDGGHANRPVSAGPLTEHHRITDEATIAGVIDVLRAVGVTEDE